MSLNLALRTREQGPEEHTNPHNAILKKKQIVMTKKKLISPSAETAVLAPKVNNREILSPRKADNAAPPEPKAVANTDLSVKRRAPKRRAPMGAVDRLPCIPEVASPQKASLAPPIGRLRTRVKPRDGSKQKPIAAEDLAELELQERALSDLLAQRAQWEAAAIEMNSKSRALSAKHLGPPRKKARRSRMDEATRMITQLQATRIVAQEVYKGIPEDEFDPDPESIQFYETD